MEEGRETERQQKKQCRQSKPWTEIWKQWKTRQDKRETPLETGKWIFPRPPLHISVSKQMEIETELVWTDEVDSSLGLDEFVRVGITQTACQHPRTPPEDSTGRSSPTGASGRQRLLQAGAAAGARCPQPCRHRGEIKEIQSTPCAHWVQKNRCQQGAQSWDPWGRMKILSCNCVWNPKIKSCS